MQDPLAGCVTDTLEEELSYGMEQLAIAPDVMRKRVEETLDLLGLAELRNRALHQLSAGQLQRVAIGAVLTAHPKVLVLDEPTSALDPTAAEEVLATITRLVHDLGVTVVMAEHRLERVVQYADSIVHLPGDGTVEHGDPAELLPGASVAPPDRGARPSRGLGAVAALGPRRAPAAPRRSSPASTATMLRPRHAPARVRRPVLDARGIIVRYGPVVAVRDVDLDAPRRRDRRAHGPQRGRKVVAAVGAPRQRRAPASGRVDIGGRDPADLSPSGSRALVGLVPQSPSDLLYLDSVADELAQADAESRADPGLARATLDRLAPGHRPRRASAATCPRGNGSRWCSRCNSRPRRASSCSTNRPAASTTAPSASSPASSATSRPTATRSSWRPTTWSSSRPVRTAWL